MMNYTNEYQRLKSSIEMLDIAKSNIKSEIDLGIKIIHINDPVPTGYILLPEYALQSFFEKRVYVKEDKYENSIGTKGRIFEIIEKKRELELQLNELCVNFTNQLLTNV